MAVKTKEEKIIDKSNDILDGFLKIHGEQSDEFVEYSKLLKEYQKLSGRFDKILKMNDMMQNVIMNDKESLEDNLLKMRKDIRKKLMENMSTQNEMKIEYSENIMKYHQTIGALKNELNETEKTLKKVLKELLKYKQGLISNTNESKDFEQILESEILKFRTHNSPFVVLKIGIKQFDLVVNGIKAEHSKEELILATLKFISHCFKVSDVVYNNNDGTFLVLLFNTKLNQCGFLHKLDEYKRTITHTTIELGYVVVEYIKNESKISLLQRLNKEFMTSL